MTEITYWIIKFTGIDGEQHELPNGGFSTKANAEQWASEMPAWQAPEIIQMWDFR